MAIKLNFNTQITRRQPMRDAPTKFLSSKLRGHVERSEGERLSEAFYPYKCLPVMFIDTETQDGVVIPKGTIVSLLTNQTYSTTTPSGIPPIAESGIIPVFDDATTTSSTLITANIDDDYFGYEDSIAGLMVPANGGYTSRIPYSSDDATLGTFTCSGLAVTAAMGADPYHNYCTLDANMPVGITMMDVYQDIRGKYLNYQLWDVWGVLCDYYIEVPYVDKGEFSNFASGYIAGDVENYVNRLGTNCAGYVATWKKHAFFYFDGGDVEAAQAGQLVMSDYYGKFIPQNANPGNAPAGGGITDTRTEHTVSTAQTVGKLILTDSRFPKDMLEVVDTYPGSRMPGTETGGLPSALFEFIRDAWYGINGSYPTITQVVTLVQAGSCGIARIQLEI